MGWLNVDGQTLHVRSANTDDLSYWFDDTMPHWADGIYVARNAQSYGDIRATCFYIEGHRIVAMVIAKENGMSWRVGPTTDKWGPLAELPERMEKYLIEVMQKSPSELGGDYRGKW